MDDQDATFLHEYRHNAHGRNGDESAFWLKHQKWVTDYPRLFQGTVIVAHLAFLLSIPPVLLRQGAPYVPTLRSRMEIMFDKISRHHRKRCMSPTSTSTDRHQGHIRHLGTTGNSSKPQEGKGLVFLDLGSGDGRVVFRAAREGIFRQCIGCEINPGSFYPNRSMKWIIFVRYLLKV